MDKRSYNGADSVATWRFLVGKKHTFQMRIDADDWRRLSALAQAWDCSRAEVLRRLLRQVTQQALTGPQIEQLQELRGLGGGKDAQSALRRFKSWFFGAWD